LDFMRPSQRLFSHASRKPLSSKHANKDYYKGEQTTFIRRRHPLTRHPKAPEWLIFLVDTELAPLENTLDLEGMKLTMRKSGCS
jgi:hypothetical protein